MTIDVKKNWDIISIIVFSLILVLIINILSIDVIRFIIGLPFLLFFPGYVTINSLFPKEDEIGTIDRIAYSFGLSIAITPLIGFGLNYTSFGIRLEPILICLVIYNLTLGCLALYRRSSVQSSFAPPDIFKLIYNIKNEIKREIESDKILTVALILAIIATAFILAYVISIPKQSETYTEFYILGPGGKALDYPSNMTQNEPGHVIIGIVNHESVKINYTIEIWLVNISLDNNISNIQQLYYFDIFNIILNNTNTNIQNSFTSQFETNYSFSLNLTGHFKLWFILYKDNVPPLPHDPHRYDDFSNTTATQRIYDSIDNKYQSLNLNLNVAA